MTDLTNVAVAAPATTAAHKHYFIAWRWHFYAGLYVMPFFSVLAITGLIMLWVSWLAGIGGERMTVMPTGTPLPVSVVQAAAEAALPGSAAIQYLAPLSAERVAIVAVTDPGGVTTGIAVNPYTAAILQKFPWRAGWYDLASEIHGNLLLGTVGDRMIEIAASLGLIMVVTGLYLYWPGQGSGWRGRLLPRITLTGRSFWKSLHGVVGLWVSLLLVLFLISGLSWSGIWGERFVQAWSSFPAEKWDNVPLSENDIHAEMNHGTAHEVPWGLEKTPMPVSGSAAGLSAIDGAVTLDSVAQFARGLGFDGRFQITLPKDESGVWTISHDSMSNDGRDPAADRTIHIDRFTGKVLADVTYHDYTAYAKAMAWGVAFHEGDLGAWNLILNTVVCLSVLALSLSGVIMWWKRRPKATWRLAAPPKPGDNALWKRAAAIVVMLGLIFPLAGFAIAAILLIDVTALRALPGLRRALS